MIPEICGLIRISSRGSIFPVATAVSYTHLDVYKRHVALSVINDNNTSETKELIGKPNLERTAMIAAAADASVKTVLRYDLNIGACYARRCDKRRYFLFPYFSGF